ncbi:MAG: InlB B-repeat-containing protein, partial [Oscillospiraceae bacterium]|nr:InlB B-repeat-containing protein [Oscillospiraceae bacterium]
MKSARLKTVALLLAIVMLACFDVQRVVTQAEAAPQEGDIAYGITGTSNQGGDDPDINIVTDGDRDTAWGGRFNANGALWFNLDFGDVKSISYIYVKFQCGGWGNLNTFVVSTTEDTTYPSGDTADLANIIYSGNGNNFTHSGNNTPGEIRIAVYGNAQQIRVRFNDQNSYRLYAVEVYESDGRVNLAHNSRIATHGVKHDASDNRGGLGVARAFDGNPTSEWQAQGYNSVLYVDLGSTYDLNQISLITNKRDWGLEGGGYNAEIFRSGAYYPNPNARGGIEQRMSFTIQVSTDSGEDGIAFNNRFERPDDVVNTIGEPLPPGDWDVSTGADGGSSWADVGAAAWVEWGDRWDVWNASHADKWEIAGWKTVVPMDFYDFNSSISSDFNSSQIYRHDLPVTTRARYVRIIAHRAVYGGAGNRNDNYGEFTGLVSQQGDLGWLSELEVWGMDVIMPDPQLDYTVTYLLDGGEGTFEEQVKDHDAAIGIHPHEPTKDGYEFGGWSASPSGSGGPYLAGETIDAAINQNITLTAIWNAIVPGVFTITFRISDGHGDVYSFPVTSQTKLAGE